MQRIVGQIGLCLRGVDQWIGQKVCVCVCARVITVEESPPSRLIRLGFGLKAADDDEAKVKGLKDSIV